MVKYKKHTAILKNKPLLSVFADSKVDAERIISIHLRGRPGKHNLYKQWVSAGKEIKSG